MTAEVTVRALRDHIDVAARAQFAELDDRALVATLDALLAAAAAAWPDLAVDPARFGAQLAARLGATASPAMLARLHHDVWLAVAIVDGAPAALGYGDDIVSSEVGRTARRLRATPDQTDELLAEMRRIVFVGDEPRRIAGIQMFTGTGDLRGYVRIIASRTLVRILQRDRREPLFEQDALDELGPGLVSALDPQTVLLREQHRPALDAALRGALATLEPRLRAILRYHLIDGWNIDQIGKRYRVHRATAARWLADARDQVGKAIRGELARRLAIAKSDVDSLVVMLTSGFDITLERLLAVDPDRS